MKNGETGYVPNAVNLAEADSNFVNENVSVDNQATLAALAQTINSNHATAKNAQRNGEIGNVQNVVKLAEVDSNFVNENVSVGNQAIPAVQAQTMSSDHATAKHAQADAHLVLL